MLKLPNSSLIYYNKIRNKSNVCSHVGSDMGQIRLPLNCAIKPTLSAGRRSVTCNDEGNLKIPSNTIPSTLNGRFDLIDACFITCFSELSLPHLSRGG